MRGSGAGGASSESDRNVSGQAVLLASILTELISPCRCDDVMKASPALKHSTAVNIFLALSSTIEWKRCIELIENYDIKCAHSTVATFSLLAANAFWADEPSIGWQLLDKIVETDFAPQCIAFVAYWNHCSQHHDDKVERIEKMLEFISANDVLISRNVLNGLQAAVEEVVLRHTEIDFG